MRTVGAGTKIEQAVTLMHDDDKPISIGDYATLLRGTEILGPVTIGDRTFINRDVYIRPNTTIGDDVAIGPFTKLVTDTHEIGPPTRRAGAVTYAPISIGAGTWVGASVTILGGVTVGPGCVIAAGALVVKDVPANTLVGGVPAHHIRDLDGSDLTPQPRIRRNKTKRLARRQHL